MRARIEIAGKGRVAFDDVAVQEMEEASQVAVAARKASDAARIRRSKKSSPEATKKKPKAAEKSALARAADVVTAELRRGRHARGATPPRVSVRSARVGRTDTEVVVIEHVTSRYLERLGRALLRAAEHLDER